MTAETSATTAIVAAPAAPVAFARQALLEHFLEGQDPKTRAEYGRALSRYVDFAAAAYDLSLPAERILEDWFLRLPDGGAANEVALRWRAELQKHYAPKTVNQRLSALRSLVKLAKLLGRVHWTLDVKNVKAKAFRDTRGTGYEGYRKLLSANQQKYGDTPLGRRNLAMLRLMFDLALRKDSVLSLRVCDVDVVAPDEGRVRPLFKRRGRHESCREERTLPEPTRKVIAAWMEAHPLAPFGGTEALFVSMDTASGYRPLSGKGAWEVVKTLGEEVGIRAYPHALRHAACTHALELTRDPRKVQKLMGHASIATTMIYNDAVDDHAGEVARLIAGRDD
jgi:integrase/recombinase XerC